MAQVYPEPTVGALIINNKKEILLVKSHKWLNNKYSVPGGHVEIGESFEEAIIREVKEETGLEIVPKRLFMIQECVQPKEFFKKKHFFDMFFSNFHIGKSQICGRSCMFGTTQYYIKHIGFPTNLRFPDTKI